jgi:hypothetical protein
VASAHSLDLLAFVARNPGDPGVRRLGDLRDRRRRLQELQSDATQLALDLGAAIVEVDGEVDAILQNLAQPSTSPRGRDDDGER